jgi:hypothetical protein
MFIMRGAAPPSSRKLTETPDVPPVFVDAKAPSKKGRRLTAVPLNIPGAKIPGTALALSLLSVQWLEESGINRVVDDLQLPMTAVLTTRVKTVFWLAAVFDPLNNAVV